MPYNIQPCIVLYFQNLMEYRLEISQLVLIHFQIKNLFVPEQQVVTVDPYLYQCKKAIRN